MTIAYKLVTICFIATFTQAQLNYNNPSYIPDYLQTQSSYAQVRQLPLANIQGNEASLNLQFQPPKQDAPRPFYLPEADRKFKLPSKEIPNFHEAQSSYNPIRIPLEKATGNGFLSSTFELPHKDEPKPFYTAEPSIALKAPSKEAVSYSYDVDSYPPQPAEELQLPSLEKWNPKNDPNLYYPVQSKEIPTSLYPKKYNKEPKLQSLEKSKVILTDANLALKQKAIEKVLLSLAKLENKKRLEQEKKLLEQEPEESREQIYTDDSSETQQTF